MRILRVFPKRTTMTPTDDLVFIGEPPFGDMRPGADDVDEIHVSCTFTWDRKRSERLAAEWEEYYPGKVRLGGPVFDTSETVKEFAPGRYLKPGVTITSRGCSRGCKFCLVPKREGRFRELNPFSAGYEIQDNNILGASQKHFDAVCEMLSRQRRSAIFSGGLDVRLLTPWHAERLKPLRIDHVFLAFDSDSPGLRQKFQSAVELLGGIGLPRDKMRTYILLGFQNDTTDAAWKRVAFVWDVGARPFGMLFRDADGTERTEREWKRLQKTTLHIPSLFGAMNARATGDPNWTSGAPFKRRDTETIQMFEGEIT